MPVTATPITGTVIFLLLLSLLIAQIPKPTSAPNKPIPIPKLRLLFSQSDAETGTSESNFLKYFLSIFLSS